VFDWIRKAFDWATGKVDSITASWVNTLIRGVWTFLTGLFRTVIDAWNDFYTAAMHYADSAILFFAEVYNWIKWFLDVFWRQWLAWVHKNIIEPLLVAYHWVIHEGAIVWHYLTHAADLVEFFWDALIVKLEAESWNIGEKLGKFFLSLIIKNLDKFAHLIEDIIDAVF
jgi:hypothetical protein